MLVTTIGQVLAISSLAVIGLLIRRFARIELTLACLMTGFLAGLLLPYIEFDTGIRAHNLQDLVFYLILPVLIFEAAWHIKPVLLRRWLMPVLIMATFGVLLCAFIAAGLIYLGIGHPEGFPWLAALLAATILSATDPVAVITQLRSANAPDDLTTLFEGESLFNDATVVVLFSIVLGVASSATQTETSSYLTIFTLVFVGGLVVGLISGLITTAVVLLIGSSVASRFILVFSAFASFYVAEHLLHVSGIMTVMMAALVTRFALKEVEDTVADGIAPTWEWLGLYFNSILFVIMGLVITLSMFQEQWLAMVIAILATLVARAISVVLSCFVAKPFGDKIPGRWQVLLVWGGLRGAIAIALVLSLPVSLPYWWTIQSMVFGVVVFSLLVQGTTNKLLVKKLTVQEADEG